MSLAGGEGWGGVGECPWLGERGGVGECPWLGERGGVEVHMCAVLVFVARVRVWQLAVPLWPAPPRFQLKAAQTS